MPSVPISKGPQVQQRALPGARLTAAPTEESLGAGIGVAAGNAAHVGHRIAVEEAGKADKQAISASLRRLNDWEIEKIHDAKTGAAQLRGDKAFDLPKRLDEDYSKTLEDIRATLTPRQQKQFNQMAESRRASVIEWANKHEAGERERFYDQEADADIESSKERIALNPEVAASEIRIMQDRAVSRLRDKGVPTEAIRQRIQADETDAHGRVISGLIAKGDDAGAEAYFANAKDRMDKEAADKFGKMVEETSRLGKAQRLEDRIGRDIDAGMIRDEKSAVDAAKEMAGDDPKLREVLVNRARDSWQFSEKVKKDKLDSQFMAGNTLLETSGGDIDAVQRELGPAWFEMDQGKRDAMRANARRRKLGEEPITDDRVYLSFPKDPREIARISEADLIAEFKPALDNADWNRVRETWRNVKEAEVAGRLTKDPKLNAQLSFKDEIENAATLSGIVPMNKKRSKWSESEVRLYAEFERRAARDVEAAEVIKKAPLDGTERQKIIDDLVTKKVFIDGWGFDRQAPAGLLSEDEKAKAYVPIDDIPPSEIEKMTNLGISTGNGKPSKDRLQRAWAAYLRKDRESFNSILGGE